MAVSMRAVPALAVVLLASVFVVADDAQKSGSKSSDSGAQAAAGEAKADAKAGAKAPGQSQTRQVRLTKPWRDLASLSDEQKKQINQIHRKAVQEIKAIEQREKDDIMALLSDEQKAEVTAMLEKDAAARKARSAQQRQARPAAGGSQKTSGADAAAPQKAEADSKSAAGAN